MAETAPATKDNKNWADMDHDEEDEHEDIGLKSKEPAANNEEAKKEEGEAGAAQTGDKPKRVKKDYGAAYDPNYRNKKWRKGVAGVAGDKNMVPAIARQKNERGDYVVTSFVIPERKDAVKPGEKVSYSRKNSNRG